MGDTRQEKSFGLRWKQRHPLPLTAVMAWIVFAFLLLPSFIIFPISFGNQHEIVFPPPGFHLDLYRLFFTTSNWVPATIQSLKVALLSTAAALVLGTLAAYGLERSRIPGKQLLLVLLLSPLLIPGVVIALGLYSYFAAIGLTGTVALVVGHTVLLCPFVIVTVSAGISELDASVETAASIMGAGRLRIFTVVVVPQLGPSLFSAALFSFLMSFDELVIAWFIAGPQSMTLPVKMYSSVQTETSPILAAVSTMLTVLSLIICIAAESARNLWRSKRSEVG
jgi:putative spermidine/putrescine transport system permease protein